MRTKSDWVNPSPEQLKEVQDLYDHGLYLQAYAAAQRVGPLRQWRSPAARVLGGRLATNLGAPRMSQAMQTLAWREGHTAALPYYARVLGDRAGLLAVWGFLDQHSERIEKADPDTRSDCYGLRAWVLGWFRDFDAAEDWMRRAHEAMPGLPWTFVMEAELLERQDRYEESAETARQALELRPWYRPGVQAVAEALERLGRDEEALDLLTQASARIESMYVLSQLARLQATLERYTEARESLERGLSMAPLLEPGYADGFTRIRADLAYYCGEDARAVELLGQSRHPYLQKLAESLRNSDPAGRAVRLAVPFVQQHHVTCAPATLTSISQFWKMAADHIDIAEEICYDGTPNYSQRKWAESQGWATLEFAATWSDSVALLDRGIPFTLATVIPGRSHLQAVIGYDPRRRTWWIRDPSLRHLYEIIADEIIERNAFHGPHAMALVPATMAQRLADLSLTDADLYDKQYAIHTCLERHDREGAQLAYERLIARSPEHRLTREARYLLARYDADPVSALHCIEQMLTLAGDNVNLVLQKLSILHDLGRQQERLDVLCEACAKPKADPLLIIEYGRDLLDDAREHTKAIALLQRGARFRPDQAQALHALGRLSWQSRDLDTAVRLYRWAACLEDKAERFAYSYFMAGRAHNRTEEVLGFLRERFRRYGARSGLPAQTLAWALDQLDQPHRSFEVLEEALRLRPDDGGLLLYAASAFGRFRHFDRAAALIAQTHGHATNRGCLDAIATLASYQGDLEGALTQYRKVIELEPLSTDAHAAIARILLATQGMEVALAHLESVAQQFPHHYGIQQLWIGWLRNEDMTKAEIAVRHVIRLNPADVWAHRELAIVLNRMNRADEAIQSADIAVQLDPGDGRSVALRGHLAQWIGRTQEARDLYRTALALSVDLPAAIDALLNLCHDAAQQRETLAFIHQELARQVTTGDGLVEYHRHARQILNAEELLATLQEARRLRSDLPQTWSLTVRQLREMGRLDEAHALATEASERFPLTPSSWQDLSQVCQARSDTAGELAACERELALCPLTGETAQHVAEIYQRLGRLEEAKAVLERAIAQQPLDPETHALLAEVLWNKDERPAAFDRLRLALRIEFDRVNRWILLRHWGQELERLSEVESLAAELTQRYASHARAWLMLAEVLVGQADLDRRLEAIDQAVRLRPSMVDAHVVKTDTLMRLGRFDEAIKACRPAVFDGQLPVELRGQEAAVLAKQGRLPDAIKSLESTIEQYPNYAWGLSRLTDWLEQSKEHPRALKYAERLVILWPDSAPSYGYRGQARFNCDDRSGAIADFRHALALDPRYHFASHRLFRMHMEKKELEPATQILDHLKTHVQDHHVQALEVELLAGKREPEVLKILHGLCVAKLPNTSILDRAIDPLLEIAWHDKVQTVLEATLDDGTANCAAGMAWGKQFAMKLPTRECWRRINRWFDKGEGGPATAAMYINELIRLKHTRLARRFIRKHRAALHRPYQTWNLVGWALVNMDRHTECLKWLGDWATRSESESDDLLHVALSLRHLRRHSEAHAVSESAIQMPMDDEMWRHHAWLAFDEAAAGRSEAARTHLAKLPTQIAAGYYTLLCGFTRAMLQIQEAPRGDKAVLKQAKKTIGSAIANASHWRRIPELRFAHKRCARRIAQDNGRLTTRIWAMFAASGG